MVCVPVEVLVGTDWDQREGVGKCGEDTDPVTKMSVIIPKMADW